MSLTVTPARARPSAGTIPIGPPPPPRTASTVDDARPLDASRRRLPLDVENHENCADRQTHRNLRRSLGRVRLCPQPMPADRAPQGPQIRVMIAPTSVLSRSKDKN